MMNSELIAKFTGRDVSIEIDDDIAILRFGKNAINYLIDLSKRDNYFELLDAVNEDPEIKILLRLCEPGSLDETSYREYIKSLSGEGVTLNDLGSSRNFKGSVGRTRQLCFHQYSIMRNLSSKTLMIDGLQGTIVTPFFGQSLSADLRFVSEDMCYSLEHKKYGLHPTGALPFFLPRYIGQGKACEMLLTNENISAKEALEMGLVNRIFPSDQFETECIKAAKEIAQISTPTIETTKLLSFTYANELERYFKTELQLLAGL